MTSPRRPLALAFVCLGLIPAAGRAAGARPGEPPVLVELYTAQGCATCPKANQAAAGLAAVKDVIPLTFSVDYWDYLGWADTLAKPQYTLRQRAYAARYKVREIYTPEVVVPGAGEAPALDAGRIEDLIKKARTTSRGFRSVRIVRRGAHVRLRGGASVPRSDVFLLRYDPQPETVKVRAGENKGQTVTIVNAVRDLERLGAYAGRAASFPAPLARDGLKTLILVQERRGGAILGVLRD